MPTPAQPTRPASFRPSPLLIGVGILVIGIGFGLPYLAPSTPTNPPEATKPAATPSGGDGPGLGMALARLVGCMVVVCGLCVLVARWVGRKTPVPTSTMQVLAALPVDARCAVYLVQAGDRRLLIGTDAAGVKALVELTGQVPEPLAEPVAPPKPDEIQVLLTRIRVGAVAGVPVPA